MSIDPCRCIITAVAGSSLWSLKAAPCTSWGIKYLAIQAGDVLVIPPGQFHGYDRCESLSIVNVLFDRARVWLPVHHLKRLPGYAALFMPEPEFCEHHRFLRRQRRTGEQLNNLRPMLERLERELSRQAPGLEVASMAIRR